MREEMKGKGRIEGEGKKGKEDGRMGREWKEKGKKGRGKGNGKWKRRE